VTVALSSRRAALTPPWVKRPLWKAAREVPSWHIAPALIGDLNNLVTGQSPVTFTNSSPAWGFNSSGVLVQPSANVPFIEYDPATGSALGWRIWDAVTNSIRNSTMVGAVAGTPGTLPTNWSQFFPISGVTRTIVGTGTENGIDYLDLRLAGTPSAAGSYFLQFDTNTSAVASNGQTWTSSVFLKLASGSLTGINTVLVSTSNRNSLGNVIAAGSTSVTVTSNLRRFSSTYTNADANTAYEIGLIELQLSGAAIDITLRVGLPQLERAGAAGPVVKTSGLTASSTADVASILSWAAANNIRSAYIRGRTTASGTRGLLSGNDNSSSNRIEAITSGTDPRLQVTTSGSSVADIDGGTVVANTPFRMAMRFAPNDFAVSINGGAVVTDTSGALPTIDRWFLGRTQAGEYGNCYLEELALFYSGLNDSRLTAMGGV